MLKKRLVVTLFDAASASLLAALAVLAFATPAYAYVDPSVMTYAIQAFAGVAVALGAVAGVALRRTRKLLFKALNIDENANKIVEPDVHRLDTDGSPIGAQVRVAPVGKRCRPSAKRASVPSDAGTRGGWGWGKRAVYALIVSAFTVFTLFVVAPYEIVASNTTDLVFGLSDIWLTVAIPAAIMAVGLALVISLFRGKAFQVIMLVVFSLGLAAYVQALFLNGALPAADGKAVPWQDYTSITALSALIWAAIIAIPLILSRWFGPTCRGAAAVVSVCLIIVQAVGIGSLFAQPAEQPSALSASSTDSGVLARSDAPITQKGLYNVSPSKNVVVFVLDTYDTEDLDKVIASDPSAMNEFTGFTYFHNSTGMMIPTRYAVPYLLSGKVLPESNADDRANLFKFFENRYVPATFLETIQSSGYSIGLYTDSFFQANSGAERYVYNMQDEVRPELNREGTVSMLWKCALYRDLPWSFKPTFWFWTDELNKAMVAESDEEALDNALYTMDDVSYYDNLEKVGLSLKDEGGVGDFRFIHLQGAHEPYTMDENGDYVGDGNSSRERQCRGSLKMVSDYIAQLKDLGVYDDTTIIVTADHGRYIPADTTFAEPMDQPSSPIMLVKPSGQTAEESAAPYRVSQAPTGHLDFQATVLDAMGLGSESYEAFGGTPVFQIPENAERTRYYYVTTTDWNQDVDFREYEINGDVMDFDNWHLTGRIWDYFDKEPV